MRSEQEAVAGFVIARCGAGEWEIENVVVDPKPAAGNWTAVSCRNDTACAAVTDVLLEVRESNAAARALYKNWVSAKRADVELLSQPEEDALLLRLVLKSQALVIRS